MPRYKLSYFDIDGGRAEPIRIVFHAAGIDFEDNRISFAEFSEMRSGLRFNSVPVLEIDGAQITQSNALSRYIGKMAGLYPADDLQALYCDEVMGALEDLTHYIVRTFGLEGEELRLAREKLVDGWLSVFLRGLDQLLIRGGGEYFADNRLTVADLRAFVQTRSLCSGILDYVPTDIVQRLAPGLFEHKERINADPRVKAYYATRP
ncbi:glutathione S-transferase [Desulfopila sp. IMCC35006]|uniref:glutathione S-transferase n=1 Tax=Desulfopila sp. IMCC35006 TaxID=2569542 RepID=UPI0010ACDAD1|nr:glutathione S-transferase [Desulfopila sp. IMCC35006]TKB26196.1 glutathione S-transferase [Desulfopila sp. IMCC35006]